MDKNFQWFTRADLSEYVDKYVAISKEQVVFSGKDPGIVYKEAKEKYPQEEIVLWKVPKEKILVLINFK